MKAVFILWATGLVFLAAMGAALAEPGDVMPGEGTVAAGQPQSDLDLIAAKALDADALAEQALADGDQSAAEEHLRRALALQPTPVRHLRLIKVLAADPSRSEDLNSAWVALLAAFPDQPETHLATGDRLYDAGRHRAAVEAYHRGSSTAPRDPRFPHREGNCYYSLGDFATAALLYSDSLELEFNPRVVANLAGAYQQSGRLERATGTWEHYLQRYPDNSGLALWYGIFLSDNGETAGALAQFQRGQLLDPLNDELHNRAGLSLFQLGRTTEAATEVRAAIDLRPDPLYYANLAVLWQTLDEVSSTDAVFREAIAVFPDDLGLRESYAQFLRKSGEGAAALEHLRALADQDSSGEALADVARQALELDELELAETAFLEALAKTPGDPQLNVDYALLLIRRGRDDGLLSHLRTTSQTLERSDYEWIIDEVAAYWLDEFEYRRGVAVLERIIAQDPSTAVAYNGLAMLLHLLDEGPAALAAVKRGLNDAGDNYFGRYLEVYLTGAVYGQEDARGIAPALLEHPAADADAYILYLDLFTGIEDADSLARIANRGLSANPDSTGLLETLATILYNSGNTAGVVDVLSDRRYATLEWELRHELLGHCYLETGNYVKAAAELTRVVESAGDDPALWALLGKTQYFIGRLAEARSSLTYALALDPAEANAHLWLGFTLLAGGDATGAVVSFDSAAAVEFAPMDLAAWVALGRAMAALDTGDIPLAQQHLADAQVYQLEAPRFSEMLAEAKSRAGL